MKRHSAAYRIAASAGIILVVATVLVGGLMLLLVHVRLSQSLDAEIAAESQRLEAIRRAGGRVALVAAIADETRNRQSTTAHAIFDDRGHKLAGDLDIARPTIGWSDMTSYDPIEGDDPARVLAVALPDGDILAVASGSRPVDQLNELILWQFASSILVVAVLSTLMAILLGRYLKARLLRISTTADAIVSGDLSRRIALSGTNDEFDRIAASLNAMLERIAILVSGIRRVSSDVAHDLKTPLARLRARAERALVQDTSPSAHRDVLEYTVEQIDEVLRLFDGMLRIAEIEEGGTGPRSERFDLAALVDRIGHAMRPVFEEEGRLLVIRVDPSVQPVGDSELIGSAIINLLENVLRHTPAGTDASLVIAPFNDEDAITVSDRGPGLPPDTYDQLFTRFYRADAPRAVRGHGLGLSLVAAVMRAHGGRVDLRDNDPGLAVTLVLPRRVTA